MTPNWLGRFQVGQELPLGVRCLKAGAPDTPASHPVAEVRSETASLVSQRVPADDHQACEGLFRGPLFLGVLFAVGRHHVIYRWTDSGASERVQYDDFEIVAGGGADGALVAMASVERPQANFLLYSTDAGNLVRGRNPE